MDFRALDNTTQYFLVCLQKNVEANFSQWAYFDADSGAFFLPILGDVYREISREIIVQINEKEIIRSKKESTKKKG